MTCLYLPNKGKLIRVELNGFTSIHDFAESPLPNKVLLRGNVIIDKDSLTPDIKDFVESNLGYLCKHKQVCDFSKQVSYEESKKSFYVAPQYTKFYPTVDNTLLKSEEALAKKGLYFNTLNLQLDRAKGDFRKEATLSNQFEYFRRHLNYPPEYPFSTTHNTSTCSYTELIQNYYDSSAKRVYFESMSEGSEIENKFISTYGVEFEASIGILPIQVIKDYGLVPLQDGSIRRSYPFRIPAFFEYTSIIYKGPSAVLSVFDAAMRLYQSTLSLSNAAFHIHVGIPRDKRTVVRLYEQYYNIQSELTEYVSFFKINEPVYAHKKQLYSAPILRIKEESIDEMFAKIFTYYSGVEESKASVNPVRPRWDRQWNCPSRYVGMNLVNFFTTNAPTVEFRLHGPTVNPYRATAWLFVCNAIVYAAMHSTMELKHNLKELLEEVYNKDIADDVLKVLLTAKKLLHKSSYKVNLQALNGEELFFTTSEAEYEADNIKHYEKLFSDTSIFTFLKEIQCTVQV